MVVHLKSKLKETKIDWKRNINLKSAIETWKVLRSWDKIKNKLFGIV